MKSVVRRVEEEVGRALHRSYSTEHAIAHILVEEALRAAYGAITRESPQKSGLRGVDPNPLFAIYLFQGSLAWASFITEAKARDGKRNPTEREGYWQAHRDLKERVERSLTAGEALVVPIMKERQDEILIRPGDP